MIIRNNDFTILVHGGNKTAKTLIDTLGVEVYNDANDFGYFNNNKYMVITPNENSNFAKRHNHKWYHTIKINDVFFGSLAYSNGNFKLSDESLMMIKNMFDSLDWFSMLHLWDASANNYVDLKAVMASFRGLNDSMLYSYELMDYLHCKYDIKSKNMISEYPSYIYNSSTKLSHYSFNGMMGTKFSINIDTIGDSCAVLTSLDSESNLFTVKKAKQIPLGMNRLNMTSYKVDNKIGDYQSVLVNVNQSTYNAYEKLNNRYFRHGTEFKNCHSCDATIHEVFDNVNVHDGNECKQCYLDNLYKSVRSYGYKPNPRFFDVDSDGNVVSYATPNEKANVGIEVEIEKRDNCSIDEMYHHAKEITEFNDGIFYCKDDSSIGNDGFEIVSHPMTFKAVRKLNWNDSIFSLNHNFKAFHTNSCGMHIHISRNAFNDHTFHKFSLMINTYQNFIHFISQRRKLSEYSSWARFDTNQVHRAKTEASRKYKNWKSDKSDGYNTKLNNVASTYSDTRYQVINDTNSATIEIRCFKANISEQGFLKNIEFVEAMYNFCKESSRMDMRLNKFIQYVRNDAKYYTNLNQYFMDNSKTMKNVLKNPTELQENNNQ